MSTVYISCFFRYVGVPQESFQVILSNKGNLGANSAMEKSESCLHEDGLLLGEVEAWRVGGAHLLQDGGGRRQRQRAACTAPYAAHLTGGPSIAIVTPACAITVAPF